MATAPQCCAIGFEKSETTAISCEIITLHDTANEKTDAHILLLLT